MHPVNPVLSSAHMKTAERHDETRGKKRSLTVGQDVGDEAGAVAVVDAAVVVQEFAGVARGAVLAIGDGDVVLGHALAAAVDRRVDDEPARPQRKGSAQRRLN